MIELILDDCPFCGGKARLLRTRDITQWWYGECMKCDARQLASATQQEAADKWNQRPDRGRSTNTTV